MLSGYYLKYEQFSHLPSSDTNSGLAHQQQPEQLPQRGEQHPHQRVQHPIDSGQGNRQM